MFVFPQLILPECMKLLPVYLNCVLKSDVLMPGADVSLDDRAYLRQLISGMDVTESHIFFYPRLLPLVRPHTLTLTRTLTHTKHTKSKDQYYMAQYQCPPYSLNPANLNISTPVGK